MVTRIGMRLDASTELPTYVAQKPFKNYHLGGGCGSVGRVVASDTRGPRFKSSHWQKFIYIEHLFTVNCELKRRNKEKEAGNGPF